MHRTDKRAVVALVFAVLVYPEEAWGGCTFDNWCAEIYSKWANPDPSQPDTGIQLCAEIENQTTNDEYDGEATFNIDFEVEVPGLNDVVTRRQSFGRWETRIVCVDYTTGGSGVYTTTVRVETAGGAGRNVEVESFTFTVEEDPCADVVCNDRCDGDTAVTNESCDDSVCVGGNRENCNADDRSEIAYYCNNGDKWSERLRYDSWCNVGACVGQCLAPTNQQFFQDCREGGWSSWSYYCSGSERRRERHYIDRGCRREAIACGNNGLSITSAQCFETDDFSREQDELVANCQQGCSNGDCNPDPCDIIVCNDLCDGNVRVWAQQCDGNGNCVGGNRTDCNTMDVLGQQVFYCSGAERWRHQWLNDFSCVNGSCDPQGRWVNDALVENCAFGCNQQTNACNPGDRTCVRTECRNGDVWCVDANGAYSRKRQECNDDEVGECSYRCDNDGDVVCDRTDIDRSCQNAQCMENAVDLTVLAEDCNGVLEVCQDGACLNRCVLGCFDQCNGDELVVRICEDNICQVQSRDDCNRFDSRGQVEHYCRGDAVHSRQRVTDGYCGGVLNACQTRVSTAELGEFDACADYCDGDTLVSDRGCRNGACGAGTIADCNDRDTTSDVQHACFDNERVDRVWFVDFSCRNAACEPAEREWVVIGGASCGWGCDDDTGLCKPNPCANIVCNPRCEHPDTLRYNGRCVEGVCWYDEEDCNDRDVVHGDRQLYCSADGGSVLSRQAMDDYFCSQQAGRCVGRSLWANDRPEERCTDYCDDSESVWGRMCQNGACMAGNRSDCDAMDTEPRSVHICDGDEVHAFDAWRDFACDPATGRCDAGSDQTGPIRPFDDCAAREPWRQLLDEFCVDGVPAQSYAAFSWECEDGACALGSAVEEEALGEACAVDERCQDGTCLQCEPRWECGAWNRCGGPAFRDRWCVDRNECAEDRHDVEECPCEITDAWWAWDADGEESVDDVVQDDQSVYLVVAHRGTCADRRVQLEWWENDWAFLFDDRLDPALLEYRALFLPTELALLDGSMTIMAWSVVYDPIDWGYNEYYVRLPEFDRESDLLEVEPHREELGDLATILTNHPAIPYTVDDYQCFHYERVTITQRCMDLWDQAGIVAEADFEEDLLYVIELVAGATILEVVWNAACLACEFGGPVAVGAACFPEPVAGVACPVTLGAIALCNFACFEWVGRYIGRIAAALWRWLLDTHIGAWAGRLLQQGWEEIERDVRDDLVSYGLRHGDETLDAARFPDPANPRRILDKQYRNIILRYRPGGGNFAEFNVRKNGLFQPDWPNFRTGRSGEYRLLAEVFEDDFLPSRFDSFVTDLGAGRYGEREMIERIRLVRTIRNDDQLLGLTTPTVGNRNSIAVALGTHNLPNRFSERARMVIVHHTIPHEIGHAATVTHLRTLGHTPIENGELKWATEYFNDRYVLSRLSEPSQGEFYTWGRQWIEEWFEWEDQRFSLAARDAFVNAVTHNAAPTDIPYRYINARAKARLHDRFDIEQRILDQLDEGLAGHPVEVRQRVRAEFDRLTDELVADGELYAEHIMVGRLPDELVETLCRRYLFIQCPGVGGGRSEAGDPLAPIDPSELAERDAGSEDATDPRWLAERDAAGTYGDVLTIGGRDAVEDGSDSGLCLAHPKFQGYIFDSVERCLGEFRGDPRESYCRQLKPATCWPVRESGCDCSVGSRNSFDSSFLLLAFVAFLTRLAR